MIIGVLNIIKQKEIVLSKRLQEFGAANGIRITILSGDVHLGCIGRLKSKFHSHPHAHKFLHNVEGDHQLTEN